MGNSFVTEAHQIRIFNCHLLIQGQLQVAVSSSKLNLNLITRALACMHKKQINSNNYASESWRSSAQKMREMRKKVIFKKKNKPSDNKEHIT